MDPREIAEIFGGLRKTNKVPFVVRDAFLCPFRNRHQGLSPSEDYCLAAYVTESSDPWVPAMHNKSGDLIGARLMCPDRRPGTFRIPEECPILTGKLRVVVRETKRKIRRPGWET